MRSSFAYPCSASLPVAAVRTHFKSAYLSGWLSGLLPGAILACATIFPFLSPRLGPSSCCTMKVRDGSVFASSPPITSCLELAATMERGHLGYWKNS